MKKRYFKDCDEPLCAFCVSAAFFIRGVSSAENSNSTAPSGRKQFSFSIPSYSGLRLGRIYRNKSSANLLLTIADLFCSFKKRRYLTLEEILATIQNAWQGPNIQTICGIGSDMEKSCNKIPTHQNYSPVLQRRRLSVPETIMRKHTLALERSNYQESRHSSWNQDIECSSDPNLSKKKDCNVMRKSTLLRRLWGDNSKPKLSGSFQEWQYSYKKLSSTQSLNSNHSSPEHIPRSRFEPVSPRRKFSSSPNRFSRRSSNDDQSVLSSPKRKIPVVENASLKALSKTSMSRESTTKYTCSSFTNVSDTNSDSAYSHSNSNVTSSLGSQFDRRTIRRDENSNETTTRVQESGVQTGNVTNLNVISNISLSQATLDVIFKEVMKDVGNIPPGDININTATITSDDKTDNVTIEKAPSFFLDMNSDVSSLSLDKFIISKVRTGSPYSKPADSCQPAVPRFSAVPRTSSMEVNTSEEDKEESDAVSFVDSLEDYSSPRAISQSRESSSDVVQLLPEGKKDIPPKSSSAFYIPIQLNQKEQKMKTVSELLPLKVRERLNERQQKREEKLKQQKSVIQQTTNNISLIKSSLHFGKYMPRKKTKPVLPSIASLSKASLKEKKPTEDQLHRKNIQLSKDMRQVQRFYVEPRTMEDKKAYKKIEILEIMECIDISPDKNQKSRIPVLVSSNSNKKTESQKPAFLELDNHESDSKVDQLIANILIDSLNHDTESSQYNDLKNANVVADRISDLNQTDFDIIPEENQKHDVTKKNNLTDPNDNLTRSEHNINRQEKILTSAIPKGWVTVYTVHKDMETPESTSDEGKKYLMVAKEATNEAERYKNKKVARAISTVDYQNLISPKRQENSAQLKSNLFENSLNKIENCQRRPTGKKDEQRNKSVGDWSVTISGSNSYGQMAPDVEMRLKFPKKYSSRSNSSMKKENDESGEYSFPEINNYQKSNNFDRRAQKDKLRNDDSLPKIRTARSKIKKRQDSMISVTPSVIIPRQTKTSTSRYNFSRPRERCSLPDVPSILNERQYFELVKRIPDLLAVTGRSISPERRLDER